MQVQEIEIVIGPDGTVKVGVRGAKGPVCLAITGELEKSLGVVTRRELTPEHDEIAVEGSDQQRIRA